MRILHLASILGTKRVKWLEQNVVALTADGLSVLEPGPRRY